MRFTVSVNGVELAMTGAKLSFKQMTKLLEMAANVSLAVDAARPQQEAEERPPIGFSVVTELAEDPVEESYFTDDDE